MKKTAVILLAAICLFSSAAGAWASEELPAADPENAASTESVSVNIVDETEIFEEAGAPAETIEEQDAEPAGSEELPVPEEEPLPGTEGGGTDGGNVHVWDDAYAAAIKNDTDSDGCTLQLTDFDFNGVPELLIGSATGTGLFSILQSAYTYRGGKLVTLTIGNKNGMTLGNNYRLYVHSLTGRGRVEADYSYRDSFMVYSNGIRVYDLTDDVLSTFIQHQIYHNGSNVTYLFDGKECASEEEYNKAVEDWHSGWVKAEDFVYRTAYFKEKPTDEQIREFLAGYPMSGAEVPEKPGILEAVRILLAVIAGDPAYAIADAARILAALK